MKPGMIIIHNGELFRIMQTTHVAPGNWRAMVQTKMRRVKDGTQMEHRFGADDRVERAILDQVEMEYLYNDTTAFHFMNTATYEQVGLSEEELGDYSKYLQPGCKVEVDFYEGRAIGVELPKTMIFKVKEADPAVKKATASAQFKNATLENGMLIRVPSFIEAGDSVIISTETGEYQNRA